MAIAHAWEKNSNEYKAWVALGQFLGEFVYFAVEVCHRWTLLSATPSFQVSSLRSKRFQSSYSAKVGASQRSRRTRAETLATQAIKLEKTLKIGKNIKDAVVFGWGRQILENSS